MGAVAARDRAGGPLQGGLPGGLPMAARIDIRRVTKVFGPVRPGDGSVHAFGPVDLTVEPGSFVSFLGPSGCGKSTLLLMIAGLLPPSDGEIRIDGERVGSPRTDVGVMFQDNTLVPWRSVRRNIELQLELRGLDRERHRERVANLLQTVRLEGFEDRPPFELSGGMQQRAAFCQALVHEPETVLLDEPLGKLDAMTRESIRRDLQALWMEKRPTVALVTHSIDEAIQLSSRVCVITPRPGRIHTVIDIDLPWPRTHEVRTSPAFAAYSAEIHDIFHRYGVL
jgi:NitT/TauT family transport system ATP-binding protein